MKRGFSLYSANSIYLANLMVQLTQIRRRCGAQPKPQAERDWPLREPDWRLEEQD